MVDVHVRTAHADALDPQQDLARAGLGDCDAADFNLSWLGHDRLFHGLVSWSYLSYAV